MDPSVQKQYLADDPPTIVNLAIKPHFEALIEEQKRYSHHISVAAFSGTRIVLRQVSPESEFIYDFIIELYHQCKGDFKSLASQAGLPDDELTQFLNYSSQFLGNCGNFKSFGDAKFIPRLPESQFKALAGSSKKAGEIYDRIQGAIFAGKDEASMLLGFPDSGHVTNYYPNSPSITKEEVEIVSKFLDSKGLLPENTRLHKTAEGNFEQLIASAEKTPSDQERDIKETEFKLEGDLAGKTLKIVFGDHHVEMDKISQQMLAAEKNALNKNERKMCEAYAKSFRSGSLNAFLDSQRWWIRDKSPMIETNIGFIETYRDPHGTRGEWEGFVAMVNKERTKAFSALVKAAPEHIPKLPWSKDFEKDKFLAPDFTSLEVLTFAGSGIPAGINIPNYDIIRQTEGFKNVSLGNVLSAKASNEPIPFIAPSDLELYNKYRDPAFEVQVALHELLGHGCGKLLQETSPGVYNFDIKNPPISPVDNKPITSWYKPGQTWGSVFGQLGASYEECRAEAVAMLLCCDFSILKIFGFGDGTEDIDGVPGDILYAAYLSMARAGVAALEFWDPKSRKWGQAHMQARYSILQVFLGAGADFAKLEHSIDDLSDLVIRIDRSKILSHGRPAVSDYLQKLGVFKATADYAAGSKLYNDATAVNAFWAEKVRPAVMAKKQPRKIFVQANTVLQEDGSVVLKEYEATPEGMIKSYAERTYI